MNISEDFFDKFTHICFNGEGAVHYKSGHLIRFMGLLYLAKFKGKVVASINQTIDLNNNKKLEQLLSKIYNICDFVSLREPLSFDLAKQIGIKNCKLIPDAVYGLPIISDDEIKTIVKKHSLAKKYITVTGSSILKRNSDSLDKLNNLLEAIKVTCKEIPIVFMANAKTDLYLAQKLKEKFDLVIIESSKVDYYDAIAIFSHSIFLAGGDNILIFLHTFTKYLT